MIKYKTRQLIAKTKRWGAHNYEPLPAVLVRGQGIWVWDIEGKKYLDMLSSYSALNQGHLHPKIVKAAKQQLKRLTLTSRAFHNNRLADFLERLCKVTKTEKALPMNSGAEAVETAIKAARKWGYLKKKVRRDKAEIIVCADNFHGRTTTIVGFSTTQQYKYGFGPFTPGFVTIPYNNIKALKKTINRNTVGFLVEPIQGEGGINVPSDGYLKKAFSICRKNNVLFIADEIQTGLGRTGKLFCIDYEGVKPDIIIVGKALGGGLYPVSAILTSKRIMDVFKPGDHGSTFGGNPLGSAIGIAALDVIIGENLAKRAMVLGNYFMTKLKKLKSPKIKEVRGRGLLIGVEVVKKYGKAKLFCKKLLELGLLTKETHDYVIRFAPPLIIKRSEIDLALKKIYRVLK